MLGKKLINAGPAATGGANTFASENFNTVLYTGNGGTQRIGGYINRGAVFNGSSSRVDLGKIDAFPDDVSISVWVRLGDTTTTNTLRILSLNAVSSGWGGTLSVRYKPSNGSFSVGIGNGQSTDTTVLSHTNTLTQGVWYNIIVTRNNTTNVTKLYIGGTEVDSETVSATPVVQSNAISVIGNQAQNYAPTTWKGSVDQVRFFNKELSSTEVTTLSNETHASTTIETTDIFDDNSGVALYQLDGNANDTGGASGKFGSAAIFNGSSSFIETSSEATTTEGNKTISGWIFSSVANNGFAFVANGKIILQYNANTFVVYKFVNGKTYYSGSVGAGEVKSITTSASYSINTWYHVAIIQTGTGDYDFKLYINGTEPSTTQGSTAFGGYTASNFIIGSGAVYSGTRYSFWNGKIDDVRVYSDVLTSTEVGYIYNNTTASIPTDNLTAYYKLDGDARDEQQLHDGTASNVTYAYDGTATNVTYQEATKFSPDLVWIKERTNASHHALFDSVRGNQYLLSPNQTIAEIDQTANPALESFDTNGFTVDQTNTSNYYVNRSSQTYAAWCFNAGEGAAVSNTDGTITSTVKANQDAGFSIVEYTGDSSATMTVGHGLSQAPELIITKRFDTNVSWGIYTTAVTGTSATNWLEFSSAAFGSGNYMNVSSTLLSSVATGAYWIQGNQIAYNFHSVDGYQKVGSYQGTGSSEGNFVETGFEPAFIMIKSSSNSEPWFLLDNKRNTTNPRNNRLMADSSASEDAGSVHSVDFLSNGFKLNGTLGDGTNGNGVDYIYLAIAADPDTTTPTVENSFDVVTYTGTGSSQDIDTDFKPDFVWIKTRSANSTNHVLYDSIRGAGNLLVADNSQAEASISNGLTSFNDNGFSLGNEIYNHNNNNSTYVAWVWKAGDHDDSLPQINTEGTIDSVISVNAEAGFSIVKFAGASGANTVGHGLSAAPELVIMKSTDVSGNWGVYVKDVGANKYLRLNTSDGATTSTTAWNNTHPTSTLLHWQGGIIAAGAGYNNIAYCFHSVTGYQKIGSYTGSGSSGKVVTTGFQPRFLIIKNADDTGDWAIFDSQRSPSNPVNDRLMANLNSSESTDSTTRVIDFDATSFELKTSNQDINALDDTYIYLAIK